MPIRAYTTEEAKQLLQQIQAMTEPTTEDSTTQIGLVYPEQADLEKMFKELPSSVVRLAIPISAAKEAIKAAIRAFHKASQAENNQLFILVHPQTGEFYYPGPADKINRAVIKKMQAYVDNSLRDPKLMATAAKAEAQTEPETEPDAVPASAAATVAEFERRYRDNRYGNWAIYLASALPQPVFDAVARNLLESQAYLDLRTDDDRLAYLKRHAYETPKSRTAWVFHQMGAAQTAAPRPATASNNQ